MRLNRWSFSHTAPLRENAGRSQVRVQKFVRPLNQGQRWTFSVITGGLGAIVITGLLACSNAHPPTTPTAEASTNLSLLQLLRDTEHSDRLNAQLYTRSAPSLDHYYNLKADEVNEIMQKLQRGEHVPSDDINHALDNSLASTFGVPVN